MPTLIETVNASQVLQSASKLSRCKPVKNMNISASVEVKKSPNFHLVQVRVSKIPMVFAAGASEDGPIIVDRNFAKLGRLDCDFIPKVIVLSGTKAIRVSKKENKLYCSAWVGDSALKPMRIMAADALSNSDIESKLSQLIRDTYAPKKNNNKPESYDYPSYPYLRDVYQGDNNCIFSLGKAMFRQAYKIDPKTRNVTLDGNKVEVFQTYAPAPTGDVSSSAEIAESVPAYSTSFRQQAPQGSYHGPTMDMILDVDITNYGAPGSEANNPQYKLMLNVEDAVDQYLADIKNGTHKPVGMIGLRTIPAFVNAARETLLALKARGGVPKDFSTMDFLKWQNKKVSMKASMQTKLINGLPATSADFAYVGDPKDISTWHLPIGSKSLVMQSLNAASSCSAIPKFERVEVRKSIELLAKGYGISLSAGGPGSGRHPEFGKFK